MAIRAVTYYQAACDVCGTVNDGGDYSAFSSDDGARMDAVDSAGWVELEVPVPHPYGGGHVYTYRPEGLPTRYVRSVLVCESHNGDGVGWCSECEADLHADAWVRGVRVVDSIVQRCPEGHLNRITLRPSPGPDADRDRRP